MKNIGDFYLKIFSFLEMKFSMYLNRHVFVMFFLCFSIRSPARQTRNGNMNAPLGGDFSLLE